MKPGRIARDLGARLAPDALVAAYGADAVRAYLMFFARWEQGAVAPSLEALLEVIQACGFDLPLELAERDDSTDERLQKNARLSPERRVQRLLQARAKSG